ncbi:MAG TPA: hypothetical protein VGI24_11330, partial [Solirubrobacteraceae bacterium]
IHVSLFCRNPSLVGGFPDFVSFFTSLGFCFSFAFPLRRAILGESAEVIHMFSQQNACVKYRRAYDNRYTRSELDYSY